MTTATIDDALILVAKNFKGITDKDGQPYVTHCLRVMMGVSDPLAQQVALMHDLVEDTDVSLDDLRSLNFDPTVIAALDLVTHKDSESYADYVVKIRGNEIARQVKLADLKDNSAIGRVLYRADRLERDTNRIGKYIISHQFLSDQIDESEYRSRMSAHE